jgi:hypothetical protein
VNADVERIAGICEGTFQWARQRDFTGWEKHDALNSPLVRVAFGQSKWTRILAIQGVMRFPFNLRPLLGVRKHKNPKGVSLFARACLNLHAAGGERVFLQEGVRLLDWLLENPSEGPWPGLCWGYPYPWQDPGFFAPSGTPNRIVTYFAGRALIHGYEATGEERYLDAARKAVEFILKAPRILDESEEMLCLSYVPDERITMRVMDVSALCSALCAVVGKHTGEGHLAREGRRLIAWVANRQTDYGAWFYTDPPGRSHITHDNYHTGEIVDAFLEYGRYSGDGTFEDVYERGLRYYRENLFTPDMRPRWMSDREYPYDIHGYSQGIITFSMARDVESAGRIAAAAIKDMWDHRENRWYHQKRRFSTKKTTLMRWSQAWMLMALSTYLVILNGGKT